jgi:hypothetical protein
MSNPRIEVDVVANVAGVASGVSAATSQLDQLGKSAQSTVPKFDQLSKATSRYNGIGIDFARVIQDAPFGIIGVGNNIQQLAQSYSSLGNVGDSTSKKLKLAFSTIFSSGNLLVLAVSAITTALTFYQQSGFKSEKTTESLTEKLDKYRKTLDAVTRTSIEGQANAAKEIQSFSLLRAQAENTTISQQKRNEAVAQLQKQYPEYLKGLTEEQIKTGQVGEAYNELTKGLIATAKARAASDQIAKNSLDTLTILAQEEDRALKILQERDKLESIVANKGKVTGQDLLALKNQESIQQQKINALIKEQLDSADQRNKIETENSKLVGTISTQISQGATFNKDSGKVIDANKEKLREYSEGWDKYNEQLKFADELTLLLGENSARLSKEVDSIFAKRVQEIQLTLPEDTAGLNLDKLAQTFSIKPEIADIDESRKSAFIASLKDFNAEASNIITNGAVNGLGDIGFAIGEALATGGDVAKAAGKALLGGIATIAEQLGQAAIKVGVGMISIKMAFKNPATAIAAGVALIALAGFIRAKIGGGGGGGITSGIGGGGGGGSSVGSSGVGGGTAFAGGGQGGLFQQNRDLNGELVVRGQDLVYVFGQANNRINKG